MFLHLRSYLPTVRILPVAALLAGVADALERQPVPVPEPQPEPAREIVAGGEERLVPIDSQQDSVPLPVPARYAEGPGGGVLLAPASGDPFFLGFAAGDYRPPVGELVDARLAEQAQLVPPLCLAEGQLTLRTVQWGYYLFSSAQGCVPFFGGSQGILCLGAPIIRFDGFPLHSGPTGVMNFTPDLSNLPQGQVFEHGSTWNFQLCFRDGTTSNTSNGIEIVWD